MSATIDRNLSISITLTAEEWELVMRVLSNGPYNVVAHLIARIQAQCMHHAREPFPAHTPMRVVGGANGSTETATAT